MAANKTRFLIDCLSFLDSAEVCKITGRSQFYQQFLLRLTKRLNLAVERRDEGLLVSWLANLGSQAYDLRRMEVVSDIAQTLLDLPLPDHQAIGRYFRALCLIRSHQFDHARPVLETVSEHAPPLYRARALLSMGTASALQCDYKSALTMYLEAARTATSEGWRDSFTTVHSHKMIGVLKALDGDHPGALKYLENLLPVVQSMSARTPVLYYDYLNSLAAEMNEVGRSKEALRILAPAVGSSVATAYPEWSETRDDILTRSRRPSSAVVAIGPILREDDAPASNPSVIPSTQLQRSPRSGSLLIFPARTESPRTRAVQILPDKVTVDELERMPVSEKRAMLLAQTYREDSPPEMYDKLLRAAGLVIEEELRKEIDLESPGVLEDMITLWVNGGIDPEEFAGVMSALRDCDDNLRRRNILDRMISYAFRESRHSADCEETWRNRTEARLKPTSTES